MKNLTLLLLLLTLTCPAEASDFQSWVRHFRNEAVSRGVDAQIYDQAFRNVQPVHRAIELDRKQPERTKMGFSKYLSNVMNQARIDNGRAGLENNRGLLNSVQSRYGVPAEIIVALWGVETSYGKNTGGFDLISVLATLAWDGRRADFFKNELVKALLILQGNHISRENFKGSWAGAMGQNQFMPSSWHRYAVDFNGDGHKDIWTTRADIFGSSANYLSQNGWNPSLKWGWTVEIPNGMSMNKQRMSYLEWLQAGVRFKGATPPIPSNTSLMMVVPDDGAGRAYLVTRNFDVIMSWNKSIYFALTVGLLSDFVAQTNLKSGQNLIPVQSRSTELHLNQ